MRSIFSSKPSDVRLSLLKKASVSEVAAAPVTMLLAEKSAPSNRVRDHTGVLVVDNSTPG